MVREQVDTVDQLAGISGVGPARVKKYGDAFLAVLRPAKASDKADAPA